MQCRARTGAGREQCFFATYGTNDCGAYGTTVFCAEPLLCAFGVGPGDSGFLPSKAYRVSRIFSADGERGSCAASSGDGVGGAYECESGANHFRIRACDWNFAADGHVQRNAYEAGPGQPGVVAPARGCECY